jgi:hypothetical protein
MILVADTIDRFDGPEIAMVAAQIVTAIGLIVVAIITNRSRQHSQVVRAQVENEHKNAKNPNLRDDIDDFRTVILEKVEHVARGVDRVHSKVADVKTEVEDVRGKVEFLEDGWRSNRSRIAELENTDPRVQERMWGPPATRREKRERDAW